MSARFSRTWDRYRWVPPADRMHAAAREAGFERDLTGRSVTGLEIEFGVLGRRNQISRSRFYLRKPLPYADMPPEIASLYSEANSTIVGGPERATRLRDLKRLLVETLPVPAENLIRAAAAAAGAVSSSRRETKPAL